MLLMRISAPVAISFSAGGSAGTCSRYGLRLHPALLNVLMHGIRMDGNRHSAYSLSSFFMFFIIEVVFPDPLS
jgi:hypothetical protein